MDLNLIKPFMTVYKHQSITKAAEALDLTQPAVSAALRRMESLLDKKLFVKDGRGIAPTSSAVMLAAKFEGAMDIIEAAVTQKDTMHTYVIEPSMHQIRDMNSVVVHEPPIEEALLLEHLRAQKIDLVIDTVIAEDRAFVVEHLYDEEIVAVCRQDHPRIQGSISQAQFYSERHVYCKIRRRNINGHKFKIDSNQLRDVRIEVSSLANVLFSVSDTDYIGACSRSMAEKWAESLNLQILDFPIPLDKIPVHMLYHRRYLNDPVQKQIREEIKAKFGQKCSATPA